MGRNQETIVPRPIAATKAQMTISVDSERGLNIAAMKRPPRLGPRGRRAFEVSVDQSLLEAEVEQYDLLLLGAQRAATRLASRDRREVESICSSSKWLSAWAGTTHGCRAVPIRSGGAARDRVRRRVGVGCQEIPTMSLAVAKGFV